MKGLTKMYKEAQYNCLMKYLLLTIFLLAGSMSLKAQPVIKSVIPDYSHNSAIIVWAADTPCQAYRIRYKVNSGNFSNWDSTVASNLTSKWYNFNFSEGDTITFNMGVKKAGVWSASSTKFTYVKRYWPVLNQAKTGPSRNLMHNFNQPIMAGGDKYFHEGVDINGDYNYKTETVIASFSGHIVSFGQGETGKYINVQVFINGVNQYYQYNHMKNLRPYLTVGTSIKAGDTIGEIVDSFWNTQCYHIHFHRWLNGVTMLAGTRHALQMYLSNEDKDPGNNKPVTLNTNDDNKYFKFLLDSNWANTTVDTVAYNRVDIQWELLDRMSTNGFYQNPHKVGYYIRKKVGNNWVDTVRSAASPYLLFKCDEFLSDSFNKTSNSLLNAMIIPWDSYRSKPPVTPDPDYDFWQWFTWLLTNTSGFNGSKTNLDDSRSWATNARNTETWSNGAGPTGNKARSPGEWEFPDGVYKVYAVVGDLIHDTFFTKNVMVQNFRPMVREVEVYADNNKVYHARWNWSSANNRYEYQLIRDTVAVCNKPVRVVIYLTEPMKSVKLEVPSLSYSEEKNTATDTLTKWEFTIPVDKVAGHTYKKHKLFITGKDLYNQDIFGFQNQANLSGNNIPKLNSNGTWTPSTPSQSDKAHYFNFDSLTYVGITKQDIKCHGDVSGMVKAIPHSGELPYSAYLWNYGGARTQTLAPVPAGYYKVMAQDARGCKGYADTTVEEPLPINVNILGGPAVIPFCVQDGNPTVTLTAVASGGTAPYTYSWPNQTLVVSATGIYRCDVVDDNGCKASGATFVWFIPILCSRDPNDITGPEGFGPEHFVSKSDPLYYNVRFENDPKFASAPAQRVIVTLPFDPKMDMYTFRLKDFGFGDFTFQAPANKTSYATRIDVKDSLGVYVDFIAGIDPTKGEAFWIFESIGPDNGLPPSDPSKGFLPVNDSITHRGEGFVSFYIFPKTTVKTSDTVKAQAKIVFDIHSPIYTNTWANVFDAGAPDSKVDSLPPSVDTASVVVTWKGSDDNKGSGVKTYDLYVSENSSNFSLYKKDIADTFTIFSGEYGNEYRFYTRAKDNVGNKEAAKTTGEATIKIKPFQMIVKPDSLSAYCKGTDITIAWRKVEVPLINIKYTADSGRTYVPIANGIDITDSTYTWEMPDSIVSGKYYRILITNALNDAGLSFSDYFPILNLPVANAGNDKTICSGKSVTIGGSPTASGTKAPYIYSWRPYTTLNDDSASNPVASPTTTTAYQLVVKDSFGCMNTDSVMVTVNPTPVVSFSAPVTGNCLYGNTFNFYNTSTLSSGNYTRLWRFGDGTTATADTATHSYTTHGNFNVWLIATSDASCSDSSYKTINVYPMPQPGFTINDTGQCLSGNNFVMTDTSKIASGSMSYLWRFDNSATSNSQHPSTSFTSKGIHFIRQIITSDKGCMDSVTKTVSVFEMPVASFTIDNDSQCLSGNSFKFSNNSSIGSGTLTYLWNFGNGDTSTAVSPSKSYSSANTYSVKLKAISNEACIDSVTENIRVFPQPAVQFSVNTAEQCLTGNNFSFTNSSTISSGNITYRWDFGDNTTSTQQHPSHSYATADSFIVKLVVTSDFGCKDSLTKTVYVRANPSVAFAINNTEQCKNGNSFSFTNQSGIGSGTLTYLWNFGDNSTSAQTSPQHSYTAAGTYQVKLIATSNYGCKDSLTKTVTVHPSPVASFSVNADSQCFTNNNFVFTNTSSISSGTFTNLWDFGDNSSSTQTSPTHSYAGFGSYTVKLLLISDKGCKDSTTKTLNVRANPSVAFAINNTEQCKNGNSFSFTNQSGIGSGTLTYLWNFGDNSTSAQTSPQHSYTAAGTYQVKLIATSNYGCKDSLTKTVTVHPSPVANFSINNDVQCLAGNQFSFTNNSTVSSGTLSQFWSFGDSSTGTLPNPSKQYTSYGSFDVKLLVITDKNCPDSLIKTVTVNPNPIVSFKVNDTDQCFNGNNFVMTNQTTLAQGLSTYKWYFGDGSTSVQTHDSHTYSAADTFSVRLVAISDKNCGDSAIRTVYVYPSPTSTFTINDTDQCQKGNQFDFTNQSALAYGNLSYQWKFGDNTTSVQTNPQHSYTAYGNYLVELTAVSDKNCTDVSSATVYVYEMPSVKFAINDTDQCLTGNQFVFTNQSSLNTGNMVFSWDFGDSNISSATHPVYQYNRDGIFTVKLIAISIQNCADTFVSQTYIWPSPQLDFVINDSMQCFKHNHFVFTNQSKINSGSMTYLWDFRDAYTSTSTNTSHIYLNADTFSVKLTATSNLGCTDSLIKEVYVFPSPQLSFSVNSDSQCFSNNLFVFSNSSYIQSGNMKFIWSFGDGDTSTAVNTSHFYQMAGNYHVWLMAESNLGCSDTVMKYVVVVKMPVAGFNVDDNEQCFRDNKFKFSNLSSVIGDTLRFTWYFAGENTSDPKYVSHVKNPVFSYDTTGYFAVKLKAVSGFGCADSAYRDVFIWKMPVAGFDTKNSCAGDTVRFTDQSVVDSPAYISAWNWDFGDQHQSVGQHPEHIYDTAGFYTISLEAVSNEGCADTAYKTIEIYPLPEAKFTIVYGSNGEATFLAGGDTLNTFYWSFGDNDTSSGHKVVHKYNANGKYPVIMLVISNNGCYNYVIDTAVITNCLSEEELYQARFKMLVYPNPFKQSTNIRFDLNSFSNVKLGVYDAYGKEVEVLVNTALPAGRYEYSFGDEGLAGGIYFIRLNVNNKIWVERVFKIQQGY
ncbi:MAG TPA: PKD domain-containing protein [Bacteroidia bacterium]|nr:PKD domain-containing protein [Bacteroidia bacterium]